MRLLVQNIILFFIKMANQYSLQRVQHLLDIVYSETRDPNTRAFNSREKFMEYFMQFMRVEHSSKTLIDLEYKFQEFGLYKTCGVVPNEFLEWLEENNPTVQLTDGDGNPSGIGCEWKDFSLKKTAEKNAVDENLKFGSPGCLRKLINAWTTEKSVQQRAWLDWVDKKIESDNLETEIREEFVAFVKGTFRRVELTADALVLEAMLKEFLNLKQKEKKEEPIFEWDQPTDLLILK